MTTTIQAYPLRIGAPKIYAYNDTLPNDIGAEVVLLEKVSHNPPQLFFAVNPSILSNPPRSLASPWKMCGRL
jgi:hypothetical protein